MKTVSKVVSLFRAVKIPNQKKVFYIPWVNGGVEKTSILTLLGLSVDKKTQTGDKQYFRPIMQNIFMCEDLFKCCYKNKLKLHRYLCTPVDCFNRSV